MLRIDFATVFSINERLSYYLNTVSPWLTNIQVAHFQIQMNFTLWTLLDANELWKQLRCLPNIVPVVSLCAFCAQSSTVISETILSIAWFLLYKKRSQRVFKSRRKGSGSGQRPRILAFKDYSCYFHYNPTDPSFTQSSYCPISKPLFKTLSIFKTMIRTIGTNI